MATADFVAERVKGARRGHTMRAPRSQQSAEGRIGASDLGFCRSYLKLMLQEVPDDEREKPDEKFPAFIGSAYGDRMEAAYLDEHPNAIIQASYDVTFPSGRVIPCHPDIIDPDLNILIDGKGLALDTPIPTPTGWTTMGALSVGDFVLDMDGQPVRVAKKSKVKHLDCYRITFRDGSSVVCDEEHIWWRMARGSSGLIESEVGNLRPGDRIPVTAPLELPASNLPIDPWLLGYWLGNGSVQGFNTLHCHSMDADEIAAWARHAGARSAKVVAARGNASRVNISGLAVEFASLDLGGAKSIPSQYLRASADQRLALLQGLMDSDGTWNKRRQRVSFSSTARVLADGVAELARSLGQKVQYSVLEKHGFGLEVTSYEVEWTATVNPFRLHRKAIQVVASQPQRARAKVHAIKAVEKIASVPTQCIAVESETSSFLCGEAMIPTHNTKDGLTMVRAAKEVDRQNRFQVLAYLLGAIQNGLLKPGAQAFLVYADRSGKDTNDYAVEVVLTDQAIEEVDNFVSDAIYGAMHNVDVPRDREYGYCEQFCSKFLSCRGTESLAAGVIENEEAALALKVYLEAKETATAAEKRKKEASAILGTVEGVILSDEGPYEISKTFINGSSYSVERAGYERLNVRKKGKR